jgi:D-arabinose 1-dehydrogenase-like Zn-dependent alcohol dehydrogenase
MRAPADFTYIIPEKLGSAEAAPLLCAGETFWPADPAAVEDVRPRRALQSICVGDEGAEGAA